MSLDYVSVEDAVKMPGLRLVLTIGVPGPWSEAAKAIFHFKGIEFAPVAHIGMEENAEVVAWTGIKNAPVAMFADERARSGWTEILLLAERLSSQNPLIPEDEDMRTRMFGLAHEICGEDGFGWNRRILMLNTGDERARKRGTDNRSAEGMHRLKHRYWSDGEVTQARDRVVTIMDHLAQTLRAQQKAGSPYLLGHSVTAADIYRAAFSNMVAPMDEDVCPMPDFYRGINSDISEEENAALEPMLIEHRDRIVRECFKLSMSF